MILRVERVVIVDRSRVELARRAAPRGRPPNNRDETESEHDREPNPPHGAPRLGMAGGSLADGGWSLELAALVEHAVTLAGHRDHVNGSAHKASFQNFLLLS